MNFFEHQDRARSNTRRLVLFFTLAVIGISLSVGLIVSVVLGDRGSSPAGYRLTPLSGPWFGANWELLLGMAVVTAAFIGIASLAKIASLRGGGGVVARSLGGTLLTPGAGDFKAKRLYNIVEEMAIASGVPVPEVYVLENETGINAFAAGFKPGDAAIGVTRGAIETLDRDELQGVIAHEFSHILNGDMRLNMKLMGTIFGILLIGILGRALLRGGFYSNMAGGRRRDKDSGGGAAIAIGLGLMVIGGIGVFFGRLMQAAVSRQREFLADASAVQFTRNPGGIAGALKKIGGFASGSEVRNPHAAEAAHMLFGPAGGFTSLFATHPPLEERIRALDPQFDPKEFERLRAEAPAGIASEAAAGFAGVAAELGVELPRSGAAPAGAPPEPEPARKVAISPEAVVAAVGAPGDDHVRYASRLLAAIPGDVRTAAATPGQAIAVIFGLLLDARADTRGEQLQIVASEWGREIAERSAALQSRLQALGSRFRLPLVDLAFPVVKRRPAEELERFLETVRRLTEIDQHVDVFEFTVSKVLRAHLRDAGDPGRSRSHGGRALAELREETVVVLSVLAGVGAGSRRDELAALNAGLARLRGFDPLRETPPPARLTALDQALTRLDAVAVTGKRSLVEAMVATIAQDGEVTVEEGELLRAFCEALHCPLPPLGV